MEKPYCFSHKRTTYILLKPKQAYWLYYVMKEGKKKVLSLHLLKELNVLMDKNSKISCHPKRWKCQLFSSGHNLQTGLLSSPWAVFNLITLIIPSFPGKTFLQFVQEFTLVGVEHCPFQKHCHEYELESKKQSILT